MRAEQLRVMPGKVQLGKHHRFTLGHAVLSFEEVGEHFPGHSRYVMGFGIPPWQRGLKWDQVQQISLLESIWRGIDIGTYSYNLSHDNPNLDGIIIDGQQRLYAIEQYLKDVFPVFGYRWSEITDRDRRAFKYDRYFGCYQTANEDEDYLKQYYNIMNFSGVAHTEEERA